MASDAGLSQNDKTLDPSSRNGFAIAEVVIILTQWVLRDSKMILSGFSWLKYCLTL
jgi:hypothetical protein